MPRTIEAPDVWVTGVGMITPCGINAETTWQNIKAGKPGITRLDFDPDSKSRIRFINVGLIPQEFSLGNYQQFLTEKQIERLKERAHRTAQLALCGAIEALLDADIDPIDLLPKQGGTSRFNSERVGLRIGTGSGGSLYSGKAFEMMREKGIVPLYTALQYEPERVASVPSLNLKIKGPGSQIGSACGTGASAIADAMRTIQMGDADLVIAGGVEAIVSTKEDSQITAATYGQIKAMSKADIPPEKSSRPFDEGATGFVPGEGVGLLVLENEFHARARGAKPYARLAAYGETMDAKYETAPAEEAEGLQRAIGLALQKSGYLPKDVDYINAHGTGTKVGDPEEKQGISKLFVPVGASTSVSSTKSMTGHLMGAAGGVEAGITVLAIREQFAPGTANLERLVGGEDGLDWLRQGRSRRIRVALSNSAGFGGFNICLLFDLPDEMIEISRLKIA
ncbi:beta-ketoacyl-[acyl-carrier-protein] synthase family protein [Candidatus Daviesbacteria bacterium]|nr:beta-ketoacyl-[acyl-carrier-protein] synthase family protein [Candidatus Daviesbacteria bacterium]